MNPYEHLIDKLLRVSALQNRNKVVPRYKSVLQKHPELEKEVAQATSFLNPNAELKERMYCILNGIVNQPTCNNEDCSNTVSFKFNKYALFCSKKCSNSSKQKLDATKQTCIKKYGVSSAKKLKITQQKYEKTCLTRHGVPHPSKLQSNRNKAKQTCLERYSVSSALSLPENQTKAHAAILKKYGVKSVTQLDEYKEKLRRHRYVKLGKLYPNLSSALPLLKDKNWLHSQHVELTQPLTQIAAALGVNGATVGRYLHSHGIKTKFFNFSIAEREIGEFIKNELNVQIETNVRSVISPYELDIYIPSHDLAIEYCGLYWHSEQQGRDKFYHVRKMSMCSDNGIQLLTIFEDEWRDKQEIIKSKIRYLLNMDNRRRIYARNTSIINVDSKTKKDFYNRYHIQGTGSGSISVGLLHENSLVSCMTFKKYGDGIWLLNRYATSCQVVGGFSKLVSYFINDMSNVKQLVSFADLRWSTGTMYKNTGWTVDKVLPPDYSYVTPDNVRHHKFNFRHSRLRTKLSHYNPYLSEWENCDNHGLLRIWDCGKLRLVYNIK